MIDNNTQWTLWCIGWSCLVGAAYLYAKEPAALAVLGMGFLRASGISEDTTFASMLSGLLTFLKVTVKP